MIEIRYGDHYEVTDLAGSTVREARSRYQEELGIPSKAYVKLNGSKVNAKAEAETVINDDDRLSFGVSRIRGAYFLAALLLALAITGGVFAYGFINTTTTLSATVYESNFADVSVNSTGSANISWSGWGHFKGSIGGPNGLFDITPGNSYTGDLVATVTIGNADQLAKRYRVLALQLDVVDSTGTPQDISAGAGSTYTMLTLDNGSANLYITATDNLTIRVNKGFYITQARPNAGWSGAGAPELFCEVAQR
jgi:hypothetical protein